MIKASEESLQRAVASLLDSMGWLYFHPPNGGARDVITGAKLKAQGVKRGVPDVMVFEPWKIHNAECEGAHKCICSKGHGIAIELKTNKGKTTPEQKAWLASLEERGWLVAVCRTMDEVMDVLRHVRPLNGRRLR
jgi:hypothetical protein